MTPVLYSQNNLPVYTKESIIRYLESLYTDEEKIFAEYQNKWINNNTIVIVLEKEILDNKNIFVDENDEIYKIENMIKYIDDLENKFLTKN